jgi:hypothetical protein
MALRAKAAFGARPRRRLTALPVALRLHMTGQSMHMIPGIGALLGRAAFAPGGLGPVQARVGLVLVWGGLAGRNADSVTESLTSVDFGRVMIARVQVINPFRLAVPTLSELLTLRPVRLPGASLAVSTPKVIVAVDPQDQLPVLLAHFWPHTRVVVVLTRPLAGGVDLAGASVVLATAEAAAALQDDAVPFRSAIGALDEVGAAVRNFIASTSRPAGEYLFRLRGEAGAGPSSWSGADIVIEAATSIAPDLLTGEATYWDRLESLISSANYIGIRSAAVYGYESWIRDGQVARILQDLLARGGKIELNGSEATWPRR